MPEVGLRTSQPVFLCALFLIGLSDAQRLLLGERREMLLCVKGGMNVHGDDF